MLAYLYFQKTMGEAVNTDRKVTQAFPEILKQIQEG